MCGKSAEGTYIFPAQGRLAVLAVDICHSMQACEQNSLLSGSTPNVHPEGGTVGLWGGKQKLHICIVQVALVAQLHAAYDACE